MRDAGDLVTQAAQLPVATRKTSAKGNVPDDAALADVFGIEMAAAGAPAVASKKTGARRAKPPAQTTIKPATPAKTATRKKAISAKAKKTAAPPPSKAKTSGAPKPPAKREAAKPRKPA